MPRVARARGGVVRSPAPGLRRWGMCQDPRLLCKPVRAAAKAWRSPSVVLAVSTSQPPGQASIRQPVNLPARPQHGNGSRSSREIDGSAQRRVPGHPESSPEGAEYTSQALVGAFIHIRISHQAAPAARSQQGAAASSSGRNSSSAASSSSSDGLDEQQWQLLVQQALCLQQELQPSQWSHILYTCAKLHRPDPRLLQAALHHLQPSLHRLPAAGLANSLWAVAVLNSRPPPALLAAYCTTATKLLPALNPHQAATVLWSLGKLQYRPPLELLKPLLGSLRASLPQLQPSELANAAWALGQLRFRPSRRWLRAYYHHSQRQLGQMNPHQLACTMASLAAIQATPPNSWVMALLRSLQQQLPATQLRQLATVLCALAKRRRLLSPLWLYLLLQRLQQLLGSGAATSPAAAEDIAAVVWSLPYLANPQARALGQQQRPLLQQLAAAALPHLGRVPPRVLVQLAWGFAGLGFNPGVHWMKVHENACAAQQAAMGPRNRERLRLAYLAI